MARSPSTFRPWTDRHWPKGATYDLQALIDAGGMVVLQYWNEPLREVDGYPASLGWPGRMGGFYMKWLTEELNFSDQPGTTGLWDILKDGPAGAYPTDQPGDVVHRDSGGAIDSGLRSTPATTVPSSSWASR